MTVDNLPLIHPLILTFKTHLKHISFFGKGKAEGSAADKNLLGGKGANLSEMTSLGIPVPPGFIIKTAVCNHYMETGKYPDNLESQVRNALNKMENIIGQTFGDVNNPLLVSIRSGARQSMPGMMETILNVGLTSETIPGLIKNSNDERFVYDSYRRLITMYADVVLEKSAGMEPANGKSIRELLDKKLEDLKTVEN